MCFEVKNFNCFIKINIKNHCHEMIVYQLFSLFSIHLQILYEEYVIHKMKNIILHLYDMLMNFIQMCLQTICDRFLL